MPPQSTPPAVTWCCVSGASIGPNRASGRAIARWSSEAPTHTAPRDDDARTRNVCRVCKKRSETAGSGTPHYPVPTWPDWSSLASPHVGPNRVPPEGGTAVSSERRVLGARSRLGAPRLRGPLPPVARGAGGVLARADVGPRRGASPGRRSPSGSCRGRGSSSARKLNVTESCLDRHLTTPRRTKAAMVWEGRARRGADAHVLRAPPRGRSRSRRLWPTSACRPGTASPSTWAWCPRPSSRCSRARASARRTRSSSAASAPTRCAIASTTAAPRCSSRKTARGAAATSCPLKKMADDALEQTPTHREASSSSAASGPRAGAPAMKDGRDVWWDDSLGEDAERRGPRTRAKSPPAFDAEHPLFILYTSGSTGKPKGVLHTTAGYLAGVARDVEVRLRPARRGRLLVHGRRRLGHGAQLHRVRPALVRRDVHDVRGRAELPRLGPLLEHHRAARRDDPLHGAHGDPRVHPRGRRVAAEARSVVACACSAASASRSTPRRGPGTTASSAAGVAPSSTRGGRPRPGPSC